MWYLLKAAQEHHIEIAVQEVVHVIDIVVQAMVLEQMQNQITFLVYLDLVITQLNVI
jgi:hypothetical protein